MHEYIGVSISDRSMRACIWKFVMIRCFWHSCLTLRREDMWIHRASQKLIKFVTLCGTMWITPTHRLTTNQRNHPSFPLLHYQTPPILYSLENEMLHHFIFTLLVCVPTHAHTYVCVYILSFCSNLIQTLIIIEGVSLIS